MNLVFHWILLGLRLNNDTPSSKICDLAGLSNRTSSATASRYDCHVNYPEVFLLMAFGRPSERIFLSYRWIMQGRTLGVCGS